MLQPSLKFQKQEAFSEFLISYRSSNSNVLKNIKLCLKKNSVLGQFIHALYKFMPLL